MADWDAVVGRYMSRRGVTHGHPLTILRRFGAYAPTRDTVADALQQYARDLERQGYRPGTRDRHVRVIRAACRLAGWPVPPAPAYDPRDSYRPALAPETVQALIAAARRGALTPRQAALLVLSTLYGLRAEELARVRPDDVGPTWVRVRTAKHGVARAHWIPPACRPYLAVAWPRTQARAVEAVFADLWARAIPAPRPAGVAWHSIRRALVRDLLAAGVPDRAVVHFLRWRSGLDRGVALAAWYAAPSATITVGGAAEARAPDEGTEAADAAVWARHPYRAWWEADLGDYE